MDVNGTRFHLIRGEGDWKRGHGEGEPTGFLGKLRVAEHDDALTLKPETPLFPRGRRDLSLEPHARRGSDVDAFGNWFWIGQDQTSIYWIPSGEGRPSQYWDQSAPLPPQPSADFMDCDPEPAAIERLSGLAITDDHYLIAGSPAMNGLIILDLYGGGPPLRLRFPVEAFAPFDIAARPGGGAWILDRVARAEPQVDAFNFPVGTPLHEVERRVIHGTLNHTDGDKQLAAQLLGISARTIYRKLGAEKGDEGG